MKLQKIAFIGIGMIALASCKKEGCTNPIATNFDADATEDDGTCNIPSTYTPPTTYVFERGGNTTVSYSGQTDRLNQLAEMTTLAKTGKSTAIDANDLKDMFANTGDNGNGNFSFSSSKQLENKCFATDVDLFKGYMDSIASASINNAATASNGVSGTLTTNDMNSTYLISANGFEYVQLMEKGLMGAVFMNQALNSYFGDDKMNVDNVDQVDPGAGKYYTTMEHHWDEAFGYFGVPTTFPTDLGEDRFWGKYCNKRDAEIGCNAIMMNNFLRGRAAIVANVLGDRDNSIQAIRVQWEKVSAAQAVHYLKGAKAQFGVDQAKFLHELSEAYAFILDLRYAPNETRVMTQTEVNDLLNTTIGDNFWTVVESDIDDAIAQLESKYNL
jgi:hypothetical protein